MANKRQASYRRQASAGRVRPASRVAFLRARKKWVAAGTGLVILLASIAVYYALRSSDDPESSTASDFRQRSLHMPEFQFYTVLPEQEV